MTNLSSMFDEVKDRYRNPFFGSFILAWFIWNWKIWVGLIWFDKDQLKSAAASNYSQYVENNLSITYGIWYPLISALAIVLLFPIIKNLISMYQAFSANWGEKGILNISKSGVIPTEVYLRKKHELIEKVRRIESTAEEEQELMSELYELRDERNNLEKELSVLREFNNTLTHQLNGSGDHNTINGRWILQPGFDGKADMEIKIMQNGINQINSKNNSTSIGTIIFYVAYHYQKTICIKLQNGEIFFLKFHSGRGLVIEGKMNDEIPVVWRRVDSE